jgi:glutamine amidotransferase
MGIQEIKKDPGNVVILDYGMGNVGSIGNMFRKIGVVARITGNAEDVLRADRLILPGVGAFKEGMSRLNELRLVDPLRKRVIEDGIPTLGICLGMQLMTSYSEEGKVAGLGWVKGRTVHFKNVSAAMKIPHMGWNTTCPTRPHSLFEGLPADPRFYFVHSYHVVLDDAAQELASSHYHYDFASALGVRNLLGVQFHPEKSHKFGMTILRNFLN